MVDHALDSRGLRQAAPEEAAWLSLVAYVRHVFTDYDALRDQDYDEDSARYFIAAEIETVLKRWACGGGWRRSTARGTRLWLDALVSFCQKCSKRSARRCETRTRLT